MSRIGAVVVGVVVVAILSLALPAAAQSKLESFRTARNSDGDYSHETSYSFTLPPRTSGHPLRVVDVDVYYNSRVVFMIAGVSCGDLRWGLTVSDSHFASIRTIVAPTAGQTCRVDLVFGNNTGSTGPQSAALRMNVAVDGMRTLTKLANDSSGRGRSSVSPFSDFYRALDLWRKAAIQGQ